MHLLQIYNAFFILYEKQLSIKPFILSPLPKFPSFALPAIDNIAELLVNFKLDKTVSTDYLGNTRP